MAERKRLHAMLVDWIDRTGDPFEMPAVSA
jgi:hypothetical protein